MIDTDIGQCGLAWSRAGLTRLQLPESSRLATEARLLRYAAARWDGELRDDIAACAVMLRRYCGGEREDFADVALNESGVVLAHRIQPCQTASSANSSSQFIATT